MKLKAKKLKIPFLVTKRSQKFNPTRFSHPRPQIVYNLLLLIYNHFIKPKAEKRNIPFLITKRSQKFNPTRFSDPRPPNCLQFHLLLLPQHDRNTEIFGGPKRFEMCNFQAKSFGPLIFRNLINTILPTFGPIIHSRKMWFLSQEWALFSRARPHDNHGDWTSIDFPDQRDTFWALGLLVGSWHKSLVVTVFQKCSWHLGAFKF